MSADIVKYPRGQTVELRTTDQSSTEHEAGRSLKELSGELLLVIAACTSGLIS